MSDDDRFRYDRSRYERPSNKYRCGRGALWERPCAKGPGVDGSCGGISECLPFKGGNGYACTRPAWSGGPCVEGPLPDGRCAHILPPCAPTLSLRALRGRLTAAAVVLVVSLLGFIMGLPRSEHEAAGGSLRLATALSAIDAGPLTSKHAASIRWNDCSSCHAANNTGAAGWWKAMRVSGDMNAKCRVCHDFARPLNVAFEANTAVAVERLPHNFAPFSDRMGAGPSACEACHVEHRGESADITRMADAQCSICHQKKMTAFDADHPEFPAHYPYFERTAVRFNHASHIYDHFRRAEKKALAPDPERLCTSCHLPDYAAKATPPAGYRRMCAVCHEAQIRDADIDVFVLPELPDRLRKPDALKAKAACGQALAEYQTESDLRLSGPAAFLLNQTSQPAIGRRPAPAQDAFAQAIFTAVFAMADRGADALQEQFAARAKEWGLTAADYRLFDGLGEGTARQIACDWLVKGEHETKVEQKASAGSWYADQHTLKYRPVGHDDRLLRAWMELAARLDPSTRPDGDASREIAGQLRHDVLGRGANPNDETPGLCAKCHGVTATSGKGAEGPLEVSWRFQRAVERPFTNFTHAHHLDLVLPHPIREASAPGAGESEPAINQRCSYCHLLKREQSDYDASFRNLESTDPSKFASNFVGITKSVCQSCHNGAGFRQDCQTCHGYHLQARTRPQSLAGTPERGGDTAP